MSRVGNRPLELPEQVKVSILAEKLEFEGPKGKLSVGLQPGIKARIEDRRLVLTRSDDSKEQRSFHGLCRSLANNAVVGVTRGFSKELEIVGVGYRAKLEKDKLELTLGFARPVIYQVPKDIQLVVEKANLITVKGIDKQRVGQVADEIRRFRRPDPYKLKGIRYVGERLIKKERKAGVTSAQGQG